MDPAASIREAVVLAAGRGGRIRARKDDLPKPLHQVAGVPLIKRTIMALAGAGIRRVHVVVGFMAEAVRAAIEADPGYARAGIEVRFIENPEFDKANGVSLLAARNAVSGPFLLSMCDHVYDESVARRAATADLGRASLFLCVDRRIGAVDDLEDATKIKTDEDRIVDIGKGLTDYDCIDCGVFAATPALFEALEAVRAQKGDCSVSDGVRALAAVGQARVLDVGQAFWRDVDTPEARRRAERDLLRGLRKAVDGPIARWINRRLSLALTSILMRTRITPNKMTIAANLVGAAGIACVLTRTWTGVAVGAALVQCQSILDGCDGELARLKFLGTRVGAWLDNVLDDLLNLAYGLALGLAASALLDQPLYRWLGVGAAVAFGLHDVVLYAQLALVHRTGNPAAFRWWFQKGGEDLPTMLARPGPSYRLAAFLRALGRRDVFLFGFLFLALLGLPHVAVVWFALVGASRAAMSLAHLVMGGWRPGHEAAATGSMPAAVGRPGGSS